MKGKSSEFKLIDICLDPASNRRRIVVNAIDLVVCLFGCWCCCFFFFQFDSFRLRLAYRQSHRNMLQNTIDYLQFTRIRLRSMREKNTNSKAKTKPFRLLSCTFHTEFTFMAIVFTLTTHSISWRFRSFVVIRGSLSPCLACSLLLVDLCIHDFKWWNRVVCSKKATERTYNRVRIICLSHWTNPKCRAKWKNQNGNLFKCNLVGI